MYGQLCESEVKEDEDEDWIPRIANFPFAYQYGLHPTNTGSNQ